MQRIYLDYASTTPVDPDVLRTMIPYFSEKFGNSGSIHSYGQEALNAVDNARVAAAGFLGCLSQEIIFTGSATEANNLAIFGAVRAAKKAGVKDPHIIVSAIEHRSVLDAALRLEKDGEAKITILGVSRKGAVDLEELKRSLEENTVLVSVMYANNEIGTIQPITQISKILREHNEKLQVPTKSRILGKAGTKSYKSRQSRGFSAKLELKAALHTDAAQAANYLNMKVADLGVDFLTFSSQKIYGPKGTGILYAKKGVSIEPMIFGGEQEYGKRAGTENVVGIVGMGAAITKTSEYKDKNNSISELKNYLIDNVLDKIKTASLNGDRENCLPNVANILFKGVNSADLLIMLDMEGVAVSAGSACQARGIAGPSYVLKVIGLSEQDAKSSLRFSLGRQTTKEEIDYTIEVLVKLVSKLRK